MNKEEIKAIECIINLCKETITWAEINPIVLEKLYNKYKEQQKELEELKEINKEHQLLNGELAFKLGKLEEENKELKADKNVLVNNYNNVLINFIPKSKIEKWKKDLAYQSVRDINGCYLGEYYLVEKYKMEELLEEK